MDIVRNILRKQNTPKSTILLEKFDKPIKNIKPYIESIRIILKEDDFKHLIEDLAVLDPKFRRNNVKNWEVITYAKNYVSNNPESFNSDLVDMIQNKKDSPKDTPQPNTVETTIENKQENMVENTTENTKENTMENTMENTKETKQENTKENTMENTKENTKENMMENTKENTVETNEQSTDNNTEEDSLDTLWDRFMKLEDTYNTGTEYVINRIDKLEEIFKHYIQNKEQTKPEDKTKEDPSKTRMVQEEIRIVPKEQCVECCLKQNKKLKDIWLCKMYKNKISI